MFVFECKYSHAYEMVYNYRAELHFPLAQCY